MKTISRYIMTLALLLTAVTGAMAQDPVAKDIVVSPESGTNISDAIDDALGTNGDWALNITINLAKGGTYTVTKPIAPSASITINGNGATIDAKEFTDHFIKMRKTPSYDKVESGQYVVTTPSKIENVTITGLTKALFYDIGAPYLFKDFTFNNCLINYLSQMNLIINFAASTVINFTITNSTFYCPDKTTSSANCIAMSGKRPWQVTGFEDSEGKLLVDHNTFYNVAYKKQFFNTNTLKGQNKYKYEFNSNIFVNVSNKKIYGNLTNNKNQVTTDGKNTYLWDGTFFSETNYMGDEGLQTDPSFKDAANGDFTLDRSSLQYKNNTGDPLWFNPKVTLNDNQTEASFEMPTSDATAEYELVRDMTVDMPVTIGDGKDGYRVRVEKADGKWKLADMTDAELMAKVKVRDSIEHKDLVFYGNDAVCGLKIYALSAEGKPTGDPITKATMAPGNFVIVATAKEGSAYEGTSTSNTFELYVKSDLTLSASNYTIESGAATIKVDGTDKSAAIAEGKLAGIEMGAKVSLAANTAYVMSDVTVTSGDNKVTITTADGVSSFAMPDSAATMAYTIKRDITQKVTIQIADRIRIKKDGNDYQAVDATQMNPVVKDNLETNSPVTLTVTTDYTLQLQKQSDTNADEWTDATALSVGTFRYKITGAGNYSGICYSEEFALFQGYEVTVPAGEYISYYQSEALYTEDDDAELYTIASVTDTEAVLSDAIKVAPAETPLLVYNKSEESKTFLLIPTTDKTPDNVTAATQFVGTLEATTIPASATGADNYALNGYAFVWVKTAIEVGANKCWLQIGDQPAAARAMTRSIVGGGNTTNMDDVRWQMEDGNYYDLNGRKVEKPNRKGIYIHNGKKVVIR